MSPLTLRPALAGDLRAVEALLAAEGLPLQGVAEHLRNFLVAERRNLLVGAVGLEVYGTSGLLRSLVVHPEEKGRGVGAELVQRLLERAGADGLRVLYLLTTTAAGYFPRFGFTRTERAGLPPELHASEELRGACPASAVVMQRLVRP